MLLLKLFIGFRNSCSAESIEDRGRSTIYFMFTKSVYPFTNILLLSW